jgi:hypothetical protein
MRPSEEALLRVEELEPNWVPLPQQLPAAATIGGAKEAHSAGIRPAVHLGESNLDAEELNPDQSRMSYRDGKWGRGGVRFGTHREAPS